MNGRPAPQDRQRKQPAQQKGPAPVSVGAFDLDAVEAEATGEPFVFTYQGREWTLQRFGDVDKRLLDLLGEGDVSVMTEALKMALGDEWPEFDRVPMKMSSLNVLLGEWAKHSGIDLGELSASPSS